ncbi:16063_t:CDS:2 [Entrophospora sp. SA101]|nr:16063_t:CDS:2 [Entrophospora sp. SA101]
MFSCSDEGMEMVVVLETILLLIVVAFAADKEGEGVVCCCSELDVGVGDDGCDDGVFVAEVDKMFDIPVAFDGGVKNSLFNNGDDAVGDFFLVSSISEIAISGVEVVEMVSYYNRAEEYDDVDDVTIDIFVSICKYLDSYELLKLECVCTKFCDYLRSKRPAIEMLWKHSRNDDDDDKTLSGMSERDYAKLLCIKNGCQKCREVNDVCVYFIPRVRLCKPCLAQNVFREKDFIDCNKDILKAIPTVCHQDPWGKGEKHYWKLDYYRMEKLFELSGDDEKKSKLLEEKEKESKLIIKDDEERHNKIMKKIIIINDKEKEDINIINSHDIEETEQLMIELATRLSLGETVNHYLFSNGENEIESDDNGPNNDDTESILRNSYMNFTSLFSNDDHFPNPDDSDLTPPGTIMQLPSVNNIINDDVSPFGHLNFGGESSITLGFLYRGLSLSPRKQRQKFILSCLKDRTRTYQRSPSNNSIEIWHPIYEFLDLLPSFINPQFFIANNKNWVNKHIVPKLLQEATNVQRKAKLVGGPGHITTVKEKNNNNQAHQEQAIRETRTSRYNKPMAKITALDHLSLSQRMMRIFKGMPPEGYPLAIVIVGGLSGGVFALTHSYLKHRKLSRNLD